MTAEYYGNNTQGKDFKLVMECIKNDNECKYLMMLLFWDVIPQGLTDKYKCFGETESPFSLP
jgi:hypothetical protein